ncbi:Ribosomal protein L13e [Trinorchestia longiramus]|nr:Ribosomal protein L13e [Trinorchestia longiramus]
MVKTWFKQPFRAQRRHTNRVAKARRVAPKPLGRLRPCVRCPSKKHNRKTRLGRGFTLHELRMAKISRSEARSIGIIVDHRRRNKSHEGMEANIRRLRVYKSKLILFPKNPKKVKKGEASPEECNMATQLAGKRIMPLKKHKFTLEPAQVIDPKVQKADIYSILVDARSTANKWGVRAKKAREAEEEANVIGKK